MANIICELAFDKMKNLFLLIILIVTFFSCRQSVKNKLDKKAVDSIIEPIDEGVINNGVTSPNDSMFIIPEARDTLFYDKEDFAALKKSILGFNGFVVSPDILFSKEEVFKYTDNTGKLKTISFSCEVCQDDFFATYAYVLRSKNGIIKYKNERNKLIEMFRLINEIYDNLTGGGTYYGHQYRRILGYAEYSLYKYANYNDYYGKKYDITEQKKLYRNLLKQIITDEINNNNNNGLTEDDKSRLKNDLFTKGDNLNKLITDYFSLKSLQEFQYSNY
jgi:hypothetical protein